MKDGIRRVVESAWTRRAFLALTIALCASASLRETSSTTETAYHGKAHRIQRVRPREPFRIGTRLNAANDYPGDLHRSADEEHLANAGRAVHGLRRPVLPVGHRLPDRQPDPRVERPRLSEPLARRPRAASQDEQLPRIHRSRVPGALRGRLRARHHEPARHDQEHRERDHRPWLGRRLGGPRSLRSIETGKQGRDRRVRSGRARRGAAAPSRWAPR